MSVLLLCLGGIVFFILGNLVLIVQYYQVRKGVVVLNEEYNGPAQVSLTIRIVIRYILKRSVYLRKFFMQHMFHIMVRIMSHIDDITSILYAKSRNWFVENAVRNRGTVPHFWDHLKVYKKEMDKEKENEGGIK